MTKQKKKITVLLCLLLVLILFSFAALYSGLTVARYALKTDKIKEDTKLNIVLIADLHSYIFGHEQADLIQLIKKQNPDLILLAGDIIDDDEPRRGATLFFQGIEGLCPIYYASGNHEFWSHDIQSMREELASFGIKVLAETYEEIEVKGVPLLVAGVEDPVKTKYEDAAYNQETAMQAAFSHLTAEGPYKILIAHRPELIEEYLKYPFDLIVSGHAHGGQVRIPLIVNGFFAPNQGWFPKYAGGLYTHGSTSHVVSRGIQLSRIPRVFNPPELVVITLEKA